MWLSGGRGGEKAPTSGGDTAQHNVETDGAWLKVFWEKRRLFSEFKVSVVWENSEAPFVCTFSRGRFFVKFISLLLSPYQFGYCLKHLSWFQSEKNNCIAISLYSQ